MATVYAGEIVTRFGADLSGLASGIKQAQSMGASYSSQMTRQADTASRGFGGMTKSVLAAGAGIGGWVFAAKEAVGAAIGLGEALLGPNAAMEQTQIAFKGLLGSGDAATAMMKTLQDFAAKTPFEFPALAEDARMLIGMGLAAQKVVPWMTAIGDAAAGVGVGTEGVERVTMALGQMQAKGKISGEEMMQLTEAGIPAWRILAQSMGLSVAQVQDLSQQGKLGGDAIESLVKGMEGMYGGQMANQAKTFNGLLSNLKDDIGMALRAFTGPLFEAAKGALSTLVGFLESPTFKDFANTTAKGIADAFARIGQFIGPVVAGMSAMITSFTSGKGDMGGFASTILDLADVFLPMLQTGFQQVSGFITGSVIPAIKGLSPTFLALGGLFVSLFPVVVRIAQVFLEVGNTIRAVVLSAFSAILPVFVNIANFITSLLVPAIRFIAPYFMQAANTVSAFAKEIGPQLIPLLQQLGGTLNGIVTVVRTVFLAVWPTLGPVVGAAFQVVVSVIRTAWAIIAGVIRIALALLRGDWAGAWNALKDMLAGVWDGIKGIISGALQVIGGILGGIGSIVGAIFNALGTRVNETWTGIWTSVTGFMTGIWNAIVTPFSALWNAISPPLAAIWRGVVDTFGPMITFISDVLRIIAGIAGVVWAAISGTISAALSAIWGAITSVWNTISGFIGSILKTIWGAITSVWNTISGFIGSIMGAIWNTEVRGWTNIWNTVSTFLGRIWDTITSVWNNVKNFIGSVLGTILSIVSGIWNTIWGTISGFAGRIWDTVTSTFNRIRDTVGGIFRGMINNIIAWLNPGIRSMQDFLNFFIDGINKISNMFIQKDLIGRVSLGGIPYLARGTKNFEGGVAIVGEQGRELVSLPQGSAVLPHAQTEELIRTGVYPVPHFAGGIGDFLSNIFSFITGDVSGIADKILSTVFSGAPSLGIFGDIAGGILSKVAGWFGDWIKQTFTSPTFTGNLPMAQRGQFILPPGGGYGEQYWYGRHQGMDFQFPQGTPVHEVVGGAVMPSTGWYPWGGEVDVRLFNGLVERYLHLSAIFTRINQGLMRGETIGLSGGGTPESGLGYWSTGSHLHIQYDTGDYNQSFDPLSVWASLGIYKPFKKGGLINERIMGIGASSGKAYSFGERGMESVTPASAQERMAQALERIERLLTNDGRLTEYQVQQALGRLLASGVR